MKKSADKNLRVPKARVRARECERRTISVIRDGRTWLKKFSTTSNTMAQPRVRTALVVAVDRIIKSLSLAPYFPGKKIATLGRRWTFSGPFLRSRAVTSPFFLLAEKSDGYRTTTGKKSARMRYESKEKGSEPRDDTRRSAFIYQRRE